MNRHGSGKKKSRIPDHLRRRALVSCDRCKKRRVRCLRAVGSDASEPCQSCVEVGAVCESTLPRKQRIYGSVETLSIRYRVLDALIKGLYPDEDTSNIETLRAIGRNHNIELPTTSSPSDVEEMFNKDSMPHVAKPLIPTRSSSSPGGPSNKQKFGAILDERLVPTPHGSSHYIGPSSSFGFMIRCRKMLSQYNGFCMQYGPTDERTRLQSEFAETRHSKALEPAVMDDKQRSADDPSQAEGEQLDQDLKPKLRNMPIRSRSMDDPPIRLSRYTPFIKFLPKREICDTLIGAYFEHVHPNFPILHQTSFLHQYRSTFADEVKAIKDLDPGWACCLFMTLVFGAQIFENHDKEQFTKLQRRYLDLVEARVNLLISSGSIANLQAILLLQLYQHNTTERNTAFMLLGCASRMAMALGMHREVINAGFSPIEQELRRQIWWTIYMFEQHQCTILGRPSGIDDADISVSLPDDDTLGTREFIPPDYTDFSLRMSRIQAEVTRQIYAVPNSPYESGDPSLTALAHQFLQEVDAWEKDLPPHLRLDNPHLAPKHQRAVILLHVFCLQTQILITRPFILRKVSAQLASFIGDHAHTTALDDDELALSFSCGNYAKRCLELLNQLDARHLFNGTSWLDGYYVYHCTIILSLDFLARRRGQEDSMDDLGRKHEVQSIYDALKRMHLSPTYAILTQVSFQFAGIVNVLQEHNTDPRFFRSSEEAPVQQLTMKGPGAGTYDIKHVGTYEDVVSSFLQPDPVDVPWDFLGADGYLGPWPGNMNFGTDQTTGMQYTQPPQPTPIYIGGYNTGGDVSLMKGATAVNPNNAFMNWSQMYGSFPPTSGPGPTHPGGRAV
ncbi:fungal-specific transcription factor domain-containing protein [Xylogone sp. PMI_703]|nr:fungal-specific transcription factor domain-containing protein [Xylogone sp. PMI_703]